MDPTISMEMVTNRLWAERQGKLRDLVAAYPDMGKQHYDKARNNTLRPMVQAALKEGDLDGLMTALAESCDAERSPLSVVFDQRTRFGDTTLHLAAASASDGVLRLVLDHFSDQKLAATNRVGDTALHVAARSRSLGKVEMLIQRVKRSWALNPGDLNWMLRAKNNNGNTPLHDAVLARNPEVSRTLQAEDAEPMFWPNKQEKSPIFLAVEIGCLEILNLLLSVNTTMEAGENGFASKVRGMSPAHAAVMSKRLDMMQAMREKKPSLFQVREFRGHTPLHSAVLSSYSKGIEFLLKEFPSLAFEYDDYGNLPIHLACWAGSMSTIEQLLKDCENPMDFLNRDGQNIIHFAAKRGRSQVVKHLLRHPKLEQLINHQDDSGNTALHLAAAYFQPMTLLVLTWDTRVNTALTNNECESPMDVLMLQRPTAVSCEGRRLVAWLVLESAGVLGSLVLDIRPHAKKLKRPSLRSPTPDQLKAMIGTQLIVATLIATVTFTAGFTVPGGLYGSESTDKGLAVMTHQTMFQAFVICNTIATYSSIVVVVILLWSLSSNDDPDMILTSYVSSILPLKVAIIAISGAFMAGMYPILRQLHWLQNAVLVIGIVFITMIFGYSWVLDISVVSHSRLIRWFTYYIFLVVIFISGSWFPSPLLLEEEEVRQSEWRRLNAPPANADAPKAVAD